MGWSYRKSIKVMPGVRMNISSRGIGASFGPKGAKINVSSRGVYGSASIPGTGLTYRTKLSGTSPSNKRVSSGLSSRLTSTTPDTPHVPIIPDNILSLDVHNITSAGMSGIKELILASYQQKEELKREIATIKATISRTKIYRGISYALLFGLVVKKVKQLIADNLEAQTAALVQLEDHFKNSDADLEIDFDSVMQDKFDKWNLSFERLKSCNRIWDLTRCHVHDDTQIYSLEKNSINRIDTKIENKHLPGIKVNITPLAFQNANGADLYFYPYFLIAYQDKHKFAVIGYNELKVELSKFDLFEREAVPNDAVIAQSVWYKANKDGSPDKRFKGNFQIPVVRYGELSLSSSSGLNEKYLFSDYNKAEAFVKAFQEYSNSVSLV